ncbi:hypothetical protein [Sphingomonas alpina]|uniref:Uncharacterized protein n=1 Tax=Sphingomonas alpina TaxID=653931 RepID=A0A7H0LHE1_9SPHN|nr:hypothetical protein [Sphingomonas alpina]QNQ09094.1 hypothetical protein H3Z74_20805 [Sphingomonas alpina]
MSIFFLAAALLSGQPAPNSNPLEPAASGMLQCHQPDTVRRTCRSLAAYRKRADESFDNTAIVMLSPSPLLVMETVTPVRVVSGAVCGTIRKQDIDVAVISVGGNRLGEDQVAPIRAKIAIAMSGLIDHPICTTYVTDGAMLTAKVTIDGVASPAMDQKLIWVAPTDGYKVAP